MPSIHATTHEVFLPDFRGSRRVLSMLIISELVAVVITLAGFVGDGSFLQQLFLMSLYLQWIGICSAAALCLIRQYALDWDGRVVAALCYAALLAVTFAVSEVTYVAGRYTGIAPLVEIIGHGDFLLRNLGISAVVSALALCYGEAAQLTTASADQAFSVRLWLPQPDEVPACNW